MVSRCMVCTAAVFGLIKKNIDDSKGKAGVGYGYWKYWKYDEGYECMEYI